MPCHCNPGGSAHRTRIPGTARHPDSDAFDASLRDAVVFVPEPKSRRFAAAFGANTLGLDGPVVYAADLGEENARLLTAYPGRTAWVWREEGLVPLEEAYR
jgi:hypothetical protein